MGGWRLEVVRFSLYVSFPVVTFYLFNQPFFHNFFLDRERIDLEDKEAVKVLKEYEKKGAQIQEKIWEAEFKKQEKLWDELNKKK